MHYLEVLFVGPEDRRLRQHVPDNYGSDHWSQAKPVIPEAVHAKDQHVDYGFPHTIQQFVRSELLGSYTALGCIGASWQQQFRCKCMSAQRWSCCQSVAPPI